MSDLRTAPKSRGRHRAPTTKDIKKASEALASTIPADVNAALRRAVESLGETFRAEDWSFASSSILGWVAHRVEDAFGSHSRLAISSDCRSGWVEAGVAVDDVLCELAQSTPLGRGQIEWLLFEQARFFRGSWHIEPVGELGWICSRDTKMRGRLHFVVARNSKFAKVPTALTSQAAEPVLHFLLAGDEDAARAALASAAA